MIEMHSAHPASRRPFGTGPLVCTVILAALFAGAGQATAAPQFDVKATWGDTNLPPGSEGQFLIQVRNVGVENGTGTLTVVDEFPAGVTATNVAIPYGFLDFTAASECTGLGTETIECKLPAEAVEFLGAALGTKKEGFGFGGMQPSGYLPTLHVDVAVDPGASGSDVNIATASGGGSAQPVSDVDTIEFSPTPAAFGIVPGSFEADVFAAAFPAGAPSRQAGTHPFELRTNFDLNAKTGVSSEDGTRFVTSRSVIKTVEATLPRGLIGNPEATPKCDPVVFSKEAETFDSTPCPANTQVGYLEVPVLGGERRYGESFFFNTAATLSHVALYNLEPPKGVTADLAFNAGGFVIGHIYATVDPGQGYAVKTVTPEISSLLTPRGTRLTVWGVPGDPSHDKFRYYPEVQENGDIAGAPFAGAPIKPFLTNPMDCGFDNGGTRIRLDSYSQPGDFTPLEEAKDALDVAGCDDLRFRFDPDISVQPTSQAAGGPTGLHVALKIPQRNDEVSDAQELYTESGFIKGIATPPLKKVAVTFPKGLTVNPSAAQGLAGCAPAQIGIDTDSPVTCPNESQVGTMSLKTPLLPVDEQPEGFIYVAKPFDNPFDSFLALYLVIQEPQRGVLAKIAGRADLDPLDGQITFTFDDLPQIAVAESTIDINGGLRAGLVNPQTCGTKTVSADFYTWQDPSTPRHVTSSYEIARNPDGNPCPRSLSDRPFDPSLSGGTRNNRAGSYSPLGIRLIRSDEDQELDRVEGTGPPGLLGSIKGVARCSNAAIVAAASPERTGAEELEHPSCPANSQVGTVDTGAGVGQVLTYVSGKVYLAGPYKGAPLSGVAIVPALAGPFDLGTVVTRAPVFVNPQTAELNVKTDSLPQIFKGIPLRIRDVRVNLDKPRFTLNPTNCDPFELEGLMLSTEGKSDLDASRFQAADCAALGFRPKLALRLFGGTTRGSHPRLKGTYKGRKGNANVHSVVVRMPRSEFLDQSHIRTVCTRTQFAADACPAASIYGHAEARTPLLDDTLRGPVYLRSSSHKLPDLVAELHGIVDVEVDARIDSIRGGLRASFESVPDVPVERFTIVMQGGRKGLLINSVDVCARTHRASAEFVAQSGRETTLRPKLVAKCRQQRKAARSGARAHSG
jgi:hypothetical protein